MLTRMAKESGIDTLGAEDLARFDRKRGQALSNADWKSPTDPEAKIAKMKNGTTHLAYSPSTPSISTRVIIALRSIRLTKATRRRSRRRWSSARVSTHLLLLRVSSCRQSYQRETLKRSSAYETRIAEPDRKLSALACTTADSVYHRADPPQRRAFSFLRPYPHRASAPCCARTSTRYLSTRSLPPLSALYGTQGRRPTRLRFVFHTPPTAPIASSPSPSLITIHTIITFPIYEAVALGMVLRQRHAQFLKGVLDRIHHHIRPADEILIGLIRQRQMAFKHLGCDVALFSYPFRRGILQHINGR